MTWGRIFRSNTPASHCDNDIQTVEKLGICTACDLRYGDERRNEPSRLIGHQDIEVLELGFNERPGESSLNSLMVFEDAAETAQTNLLDNYRQIFDQLLDGKRIVIHCAAGKDHAGLASAVVLRNPRGAEGGRAVGLSAN